MMNVNNSFDDIRPYNDAEVRPVIDRLLQDQELIEVISQYKYPWLKKILGRGYNMIVQKHMVRKLRGVVDVHGWQMVLVGYMLHMIDNSMDDLTYSGINELSADKAYLFISNHRDIVLDPALVNYGLYKHNLPTVRIAIGDNLLQKPYITDLMRLNKSFIVKRSVVGLREKMKVYMDLSSYINQSVHGGHNIWIAQREGRAKDGVDTTDAAIMKMLYMCRKKSGQTFADYINSLHIVPVALSYEYDPCDRAKAIELTTRSTGEPYVKSKYEDIDSIVKGIIGAKGRVHVSFSKPLSGVFDHPEMLASVIDQHITEHYHLHPTNYAAAAYLDGRKHQAADVLLKRFKDLSDQQRHQALVAYANPLWRRAKQISEMPSPCHS